MEVHVGGHMTIFLKEYNMFIVLSSCIHVLYLIMVIQSYEIIIIDLK